MLTHLVVEEGFVFDVGDITYGLLAVRCSIDNVDKRVPKVRQRRCAMLGQQLY